MIFSKLQLGIAVAVACAIGLGLAWQVRANTKLQAETIRQSTSAKVSGVTLEKQIATQTQRLAAAEEKLSVLLKNAQLVSTTGSAALAPIDAADALKATLARAQQLIAQGKQQEALDEYVKCYRELRAIRLGSSESQSIMIAIEDLSRSYPPARSALVEFRDSAVVQRQTHPGVRGLPFEIALLNDRLSEGSRTLTLYDSLPVDDIDRGTLAMIAVSSFIEARRYTDALLGNRFSDMLTAIEAASQLMEKSDPSMQSMIRESTITQTVTNIEVLTGAGKLDDARILTEKLLAFDGSDATRAALKQQLERAQAKP